MIDGQATSDYRAWDAPDHDEIVRIVRIYTDNFGAWHGDPRVFEEALRDDAWMIFSDRAGNAGPGTDLGLLRAVGVAGGKGQRDKLPNHLIDPGRRHRQCTSRV